MAQPVFYQTLNNLGFDPTVYYTATASVTPETPAPPFLVGMQGFGTDGSQFVFVQASTSISLTDFVMITQGSSAGNQQAGAGYVANSITTTNVASSVPVGIGSTGLVLKQSVTFVPAGAYFWALTRGQFVPATTSGGSGVSQMSTQTYGTTGVFLYTTSTPGVLVSITLSTAAAFVGIVCVNSLTISIPSSLVPPAGGTQTSTGFTVGPVVNMNNPRPFIVPSSTGGVFNTITSGVYSLPITGF